MEQNITSMRRTKEISNQKATHKDNVNWQLTVNNNGTISILTDIQTHAGLLKNIEFLSNKTFSIVKQEVLNSCNAYVRRYNYEKTLRKDAFRATLKCVEYNESESSLIKTTALDESSADMLIPKLLHVYFSCQFLVLVPFHKKTFLEIFVMNRMEPSPVVYALCATLLTNRCRHTLKIVPYERNAALSRLYFEKARDLVANKFDEFSLETMMTYIYLASYKTNTLYPREAVTYLELALRIRRILAEDLYKEPVLCNVWEYETFKRQGAIFQQVVMSIEYFNNTRGVPIERGKSQKVFSVKKLRRYSIDSIIRYDATPMSDEPSCINRSITGRRYAEMIKEVVSPYYTYVRYGEDDNIPLPLLLKTENQLKCTYFEKIPVDYRLPASVFESGLDDSEFRKRLRDYRQYDAVSVNLAALFQQSLVGIYELFSPKIQKQHMAKKELPDLFELNAQKICHNSAVVVVRLLECLVDTFDVCNFHLGLITSVWEAHVKNACLGMTEEELFESGVYEYLSAEEIKISREYTLRCAEVLRRGYLFNRTEISTWEYFKDYEKSLIKTAYTLPQQKAEYWEPMLY
ncbi:hypothetical protein G6F56_000680 [Rhizopus delemar]|nr:hypothetical protein G6F56_000680 [Rhizopus delemar]